MPLAAIKRQTVPIGKTFQRCPLCSSQHLAYEFIVDRSPLCACVDCGLLFINPQPDTPDVPSSTPASDGELKFPMQEANASERLGELLAYSGLKTGTLLLVGPDPALSLKAESLGFTL